MLLPEEVGAWTCLLPLPDVSFYALPAQTTQRPGFCVLSFVGLCFVGGGFFFGFFLDPPGIYGEGSFFR